MALSMTVDRVDYPAGGIEVSFNNGNFVKSFANLAELQTYVQDDMTEENLARIALAHWLTKSADASDDSIFEGKTFDYDPAQNLAIIQRS